MTLKDLKTGQSAQIESVGGEGALRQHFLDMGVIPGAEITLMKLAPMGDPMELRIHGYELTLRLADAEKITVTPVEGSKRPEQGHSRKKEAEHPGLGEVNEAHRRENPVPLPDGIVPFVHTASTARPAGRAVECLPSLHLHRARHRVGNEAGAEFLEKGDLLADRRFRGVEFRTDRIQMRDDALLFGKRGNGNKQLP